MPRERAALAERYVGLALAGDRRGAAEAVLAPLRVGGIALADLYDDVLAVAAARIGDLWHAGAITVADEHFTTRLTQDVMAEARLAAGAAKVERPERVVLACPDDEQHEVGLRMLSDVLDAAGFEVHLLGARTPARDLVAYVAKVDADVAVLSSASPLSVPGLLRAVTALRERRPGQRVLVGGRAAERYPALGDAVGADRVCVRIADAARAVEELVG